MGHWTSGDTHIAGSVVVIACGDAVEQGGCGDSGKIGVQEVDGTVDNVGIGRRSGVSGEVGRGTGSLREAVGGHCAQ